MSPGQLVHRDLQVKRGLWAHRDLPVKLVLPVRKALLVSPAPQVLRVPLV